MPNSTASSSTSAGWRPDAHAARTARVGWRPSRYVLGALAALTLLAVLGLWASELPAIAAWPLSFLALGYGIRLGLREAARPPCELVLQGNGTALVDGRPVDALQVTWRGPLAFVRWRDGAGGWQYRSWWPDTLPPERRRELRLAAPEGPIGGTGGSVAP